MRTKIRALRHIDDGMKGRSTPNARLGTSESFMAKANLPSTHAVQTGRYKQFSKVIGPGELAKW